MDLYAENVLDHYKNPRNFGKLKDASLKAKDTNTVCGDKIEIQIAVKGGVISDIKFSGSGCAISQAAASMLTERVKGKTLVYAGKTVNEDIYKMLNVPLSPSRIKCALLGLSALKKALSKVEGDKATKRKTGGRAKIPKRNE